MSTTTTTFYHVTWVYRDGEISWRTFHSLQEAELVAAHEQDAEGLIGVHLQEVHVASKGEVVDVDLGHRVSYTEVQPQDGTHHRRNADTSRRDLKRIVPDGSSV